MQPDDTSPSLGPADKELVERVRNGEPDDYRFLVQRYQGLLFGYLAARIHDPTLAQDAAQESLVRAFFALGKLQKPESFHAWLLGIAGRVAHEFHRSAARRARECEAGDNLPSAPAESPDSYRLEEAIAALPENHRRLILLRYYEGLSCQEAAERLGLPLGSVTKMLSRAYAELRQVLKSPGKLNPAITVEKVV